MLKKRIIYFLLVCIVIFLGLVSRKISFLPLATGDFLWAIMIFLLLRFGWPQQKLKKIALVSFIICYTVEISQLYQAAWLNQLRSTLPGKLILGQGFLWSDLLAYSLGIFCIFCLSYFCQSLTKPQKKSDYCN